MTAVGALSLSEAVREKLRDAVAPLKLADVVKGLPRPKKVKADDFRRQVGNLLDEEVRLGHAYVAPSGKKGEPRYWSRDERQQLRERAVEAAGAPIELGKLQKAAGKGVDGGFVTTVVEDLVHEGRLFQHPPKTKKGKPRFASWPPPPPLPPLATKPHKAKLDKLAADCRKLLAASGVGMQELLESLRTHLGGYSPLPLAETPDELILKAVANAPVVGLADLRREMPREFQGRLFDESVLRLADERKVVLSLDADPVSLSDAERAGLVSDGVSVYTTISPRR